MDKAKKIFASIEEAMDFWKKHAPAAHEKEFQGQHLSAEELKKLASGRAGRKWHPFLHRHLVKCQWCCNQMAKFLGKEAQS